MKIHVLAALFITALSLQAQVGTSPRTLVRPIAPYVRPQPPSAQSAAGASAAASVPKAPPTAAELEEKQAKLSIEEKKKLQWQTDRAEKGSDTAQYTLGRRYLDGDGVEKDLKKAHKWLAASAKQGNADAKKALAEHPDLPPFDDPKAANASDKPAAPAAATIEKKS